MYFYLLYQLIFSHQIVTYYQLRGRFIRLCFVLFFSLIVIGCSVVPNVPVDPDDPEKSGIPLAQGTCSKGQTCSIEVNDGEFMVCGDINGEQYLDGGECEHDSDCPNPETQACVGADGPPDNCMDLCTIE